MTVLEGTPVSAGFAMGTSVLVGVDGRPDLPESLSKQAMDALRRQIPEDDWLHVVLASYEAEAAVGISIPGLRVVGILAQSSSAPATTPSIPCLVGVEGLLRAVEKPLIVMVDAAKGLAYVDPDVQAIIAYQSPVRHRPREKRLFLDPDHEPATTLDGRRVEVWGYAASVEEAEQAIRYGADGVFFAGPLASPDDAESLFRALHSLPVMLEQLPTRDELEAAIRCSVPGQMQIAVAAEAFKEEAERVLRAYEAVEEELELDEEEMDQPAFAVVAGAVGCPCADLVGSEVGTVICRGCEGFAEMVAVVHEMGARAFFFGQETGEQDAHLIESGADGIIVAAEFVAITKSVVATLPRDLMRLGPPTDTDERG